MVSEISSSRFYDRIIECETILYRLLSYFHPSIHQIQTDGFRFVADINMYSPRIYWLANATNNIGLNSNTNMLAGAPAGFRFEGEHFKGGRLRRGPENFRKFAKEVFRKLQTNYYLSIFFKSL